VDIVNLEDGERLDVVKPVILEGAHGDEIVRSLIVDDQVSEWRSFGNIL
jgi:hypothetical protein